MDRDPDVRDLAIELAHVHVNKALRSADRGDWDDCLDQLYRSSHLGGLPYWELYRWLTERLEVPAGRVLFSWVVPRDSYYRCAATG